MEYVIEVEGTEIAYQTSDVLDFCVVGADVQVHTEEGGLDLWPNIDRWYLREATP